VRARRFDEAIANYRRVLEKDPKSVDLHIQIGETYRFKGDVASAVSYFRKATQLSPNDPRAYLPLGVLLDTLGQRAEAKTIYQQILKLQPDQPIALNNLAFLMAESGEDLDQALSLAQRARQKLPQDPNVADTLGWIYIKKNLSDNAIEIFRELVGKLPHTSTYRFHLGMALYQKGDRFSARKELQTALQSKPAPEEAARIKELLAKLS
jgi:Flp pilus assembly protein TadD